MSDRMYEFVRELEGFGLGWLAEKLGFYVAREAGEQEGQRHDAVEREVMDRIVVSIAEGRTGGERQPDPVAIVRDMSEGFVWAVSTLIVRASAARKGA